MDLFLPGLLNKNFTMNTMKSGLLTLMIYTLTGLVSSAQNYLISFAGTGQSTNVTTVIAQNLSTGSTLSLNGNDILRLSGTVGIIKPEGFNMSALRVYPNPMTNNSTLGIIPPVSGEAIVSVYSVTGEAILQLCTNLESTGQEFRLGGLKSGFYLLHVKGNTYQSSCKLFVKGENEGELKLEKISSGKESAQLSAQKKNFKDGISIKDMLYKSGDRMKFTAVSGNYSSVLTDIPASDKTISFDFITCTDSDNQHYPVVKIGNQIWMATNLKTTAFRNGDLIGTTNPANLPTSTHFEPKYQWAFNGNVSNADTFGRIYTWYAINDNRQVCPSGWHVPTDVEWTELTDFLGGLNVAGGKLKESGYNHWFSPANSGTDEVGFAALPGGERAMDGVFYNKGQYGYFWSATPYYAEGGWYRSFSFYENSANRSPASKFSALSVRCLKDPETYLPLISTHSITGITSNTATSGGIVSSDGGKEITAVGVCWSVDPNPGIELNTKTIDGAGIGAFTSELSGLAPNTLYFLRAYAVNSTGVAYGKPESFRTAASDTGLIFNTNLSYGSVSDVDGNTYKTTTIGTQEWMAENLRTTRFNNGELIGTTNPDTLDITLEVEPKYQWVAEGNESKAEVYGRLYSGFTIFDSRNICPEGWKVPDDAEWTVLTNYLGGTTLSKDKLKETSTAHWYSPNTEATNESGFTGIPSGMRDSYGSFLKTGSACNWWSSTKFDSNKAWSRSINTWEVPVAAHYFSMNFGFSVRCLRESNLSPELPSLTTIAVSGITSDSAQSGGNIIFDGGADITEKGVCWDTNSKPTIALSTKTMNGVGSGAYVSTMTGLEPGVNYFVRAYAINSVGIVYGNEVSFTSNTAEGEIGFNTDLKYGTVTDTAGNSYKTIVIGTQIWMAENLRTNKYNDGTSIPFVSDRDAWIYLKTPAYCWYNNDSISNAYLYGASYNWYTINTGKLCPLGWHVPNNSVWAVLSNYLGGDNLAGAKMKEPGTTHWTITNISSTNESGFTALPGGYSGYGYDFKGIAGTWWSLNEDTNNTIQAWERTIYNDRSGFYRNTAYKENGLSVRCISDLQPVITQPALKTNIPTDIALTGAICGGIVTSDGGDSITERGICWGTNSFPLIKGNHLQDTSGKDTFYITMNNLYENTTYFVRAYATNSAGTFYGNEISFKTLASAFTIGQPYQGGLIAYIFKPGDPGYISGEKHGLIVAPSDQSTGIKWFKDYSVSIVTGTLLGTGAYNTKKIIETQGNGNYAADLCLNLVLEGFSDWYLPSRDELNILFLHKSELNMPDNLTYWSSSEKDIFKAWVQNFDDGTQDYWGKTSSYCVRAVRNF